MTDLIIIGGGPAGLSAALYVLRAGFSVKIFAKDLGALQNAEIIDNYLGFDESVSGMELLEKSKRQVIRKGAQIYTDEVVSLSWNNVFEITTPSGKENSRAVLIASGASRKKLKISGLDKFEGSGVSYCAVCDAFFYRGKDAAVVGGGEFALNEVNELINAAKSVSLLTNGEEISAMFPKTVKIYNERITEVFGKERLEGVRFADGKEINVDGIFIAYGTADAGALARELGLALKNGKIAVDENMKTSLAGAFAAGDCTGGVMQVSVAVGEGAKAGLSAVEFLRKL